MTDDSLSDMPAFDKPENIPLVVPDVPEKKHRKLRADHCEGTKKDGTPCGFPKRKDRPFCLAHDPTVPEEQRQAWRKTPRKPRVLPMGGAQAQYLSREEILAILSKRLKIWMDKFGDMINPEVDEAVCNLCRTYAAVAKVELGEGVEVRGWRIGRTG